jgi:hypothetical protein
MRALGMSAGDIRSVALGYQRQGPGGRTLASSVGSPAILWQNGTITDLNAVTLSGSSVKLSTKLGI